MTKVEGAFQQLSKCAEANARRAHKNQGAKYSGFGYRLQK